MIVGLTGGIGSGKSTVLNFFKHHTEVAVFSTDDEAKKLMNTSAVIKKKLVKAFGKNTYVQGLLNRTYLADIVFDNPKQLAIVNQIVHPEIATFFEQFKKVNQHKNYIIYESAILFEIGSENKCDFIITVVAPLSIRVERVMKRDLATVQQVKRRIENQWFDEKKAIQSHYVIENIDLNITKKTALQIHKILTQKIV